MNAAEQIADIKKKLMELNESDSDGYDFIRGIFRSGEAGKLAKLFLHVIWLTFYEWLTSKKDKPWKSQKEIRKEQEEFWAKYTFKIDALSKKFETALFDYNQQLMNDTLKELEKLFPVFAGKLVQGFSNIGIDLHNLEKCKDKIEFYKKYPNRVKSNIEWMGQDIVT